jgi:hypothetical protein
MACQFHEKKIVCHHFHLYQNHTSYKIVLSGAETNFGQAQAQGFLNFFNPSPVSDLPSPNL